MTSVCFVFISGKVRSLLARGFQMLQQNAFLLVELDHSVPFLPLHEPLPLQLESATQLLFTLLLEQLRQPLVKCFRFLGDCVRQKLLRCTVGVFILSLFIIYGQ